MPIGFFPYGVSANLIITIITIIISGIVFSSSYKFKNSTLYNNYYKSSNSKFYFYINTLCLMIVVTTIAILILFFILFIFNSLNLLLGNWIWNGSKTVHYKLFAEGFATFLTIFYLIYIMVFLVFSISFMCRNWIKTPKSYMSLLLSLSIISIVWGGSINTPFTDNYKTLPEMSTLHYVNYRGNDTLYFLSILFPFFAPSNLLFFATGTVGVNELQQSSYDVWHWYTAADDYVFNADSTINPMWRWNILYILPWIEIAVFLTIGLFVDK